MKTKHQKSVLFVCTGNMCRSVIAEYLFRALLEQRSENTVRVTSAGTAALEGFGPSDNAVRVLNEYGVDATGHVTAHLTEALCLDADVICCMTHVHLSTVRSFSPSLHARSHLLTEFADVTTETEIDDPMGGSIETYREVTRIIDGCLPRLADCVLETG
jgi:protein-tyrosine-phosphatase